ncbi:hypothetical protein IT570_02935 [Candidatus Sumerlaeota bacterium]|nr:hypothetical protein [Candidatus Sumerlaeota bacterium]
MNPEFAQYASVSGSSEQRLFVYEGREQAFERAKVTPRTEPMRGFDNTVELGPLVRKKHQKQIHFNQALGLTEQNLNTALSMAATHATVNKEKHWISVSDADLQTDTWPLNWELDVYAARPLTAAEINQLLRKKYLWDDGTTNTAARYQFVKNENNQIWDGNIKDKTVRDLVYTLLDESLKERTKGRNIHGFAFQILPVDVDSSGVMSWNVLLL